MNRLLLAALTYAARGWPIVPLHTPSAEGCSCEQDCGGSVGKHPRTPHGLHDASRQPDQLWSWWHRWPDANVGIRTGRESSIVVLDVDPRHGGEDSLAALESTYEALPETLTAQSGGGGQHRYFRHPGARLPNSAEVGGYAGMDVRGDGGYIVAPPSLHQSGQIYRWQEPTHPLAPLPEWLSALLMHRLERPKLASRRRHQAPLGAGEQSWLQVALERARPGTRNSTGYWLACRLRDAGLGFQEAEAILLRYAAQVAAGDHPYTAREALSSLRSAYQHPVLDPAPAAPR
jgi:hypothetical protein